ncbi:ABC transporter substrate-binding protein [Anaerolineales bacterium]
MIYKHLCLFVLILLSACTPETASTIRENELNSNRIIYGLTVDVSGIDPQVNQSSEMGIVLRSVYDTLVYRHPETLEFVPGLASSWEISEDELIYTFHLRNDVKFHDGEVFNAQAVAANLDRILDPETQSQLSKFKLGPFASYNVIDDFTIQIILAEPYAPLLDSFSQIYLAMASPKALAEYNTLTYQYHQVGTGPFIFVEYLPGDRIVIRRNPDYAWGPDFYEAVTPESVNEIEFRFFTDPATRAIALESGDVQIMGELLPVDARALNNNSSIQVVPSEIPGQPSQFYFNTLRPHISNLAVRQALIYAVNREAIINAVFQGESPIAWGPLSRSTLYYNRAIVNLYQYNLSQSQGILSSLGYSDTDSDGVLDLDGEPFELRIIVPPWGMTPDIVSLLQDQWKSLGVKTALVPVSGFVALIEQIKSGNWDLVAFNSFGLDPVFLNPGYMSDGSSHWTGYANTELDNMLREASRTIDPAIRYNLYGQAQIMIMDQALILPIRDYVNYNAYRLELENLQFDPYGWYPLLHNLRFRQK